MDSDWKERYGPGRNLRDLARKAAITPDRPAPLPTQINRRASRASPSESKAESNRPELVRLAREYKATIMTMGSRGGVSPSSSPRLPSPPPFTEVQIGPKSPTIGDSNSNHQLGHAAKIDDGASRRIRPGTKASDMASGPPLVEINELDSPFQLQEHLKALYCTFTQDPTTKRTFPITKETALRLAHPPATNESGDTVDKNVWLYELCRFLTMRANNLIIAFFREQPQCSSATCPEMRASEWQYLCAVHDPPKSCCAIDYCCHTLDWATNILTSPKLFPSRMVLGGENGNVAAAMRQLTNIFRRVYRIFAHAWFQHRQVFWTVEANDGLYIFFKTVCDVYQLIPEDNYTIPIEAEGDREEEDETPINATAPNLDDRMTILTKGDGQQASIPEPNIVGATTRRHKHNPSTGSHVTTIAEGPEEEDTDGLGADSDGHPENSFENQQKRMSPADLANGMGRLNLSSTIPAFDIQAPADPTPLASAYQGFDPMNAAVLSAKGKNDLANSDTTEVDDKDAVVKHLESLTNVPGNESDAEITIKDNDDSTIEENETMEEESLPKTGSKKAQKEKVEHPPEGEGDEKTKESYDDETKPEESPMGTGEKEDETFDNTGATPAGVV